jgi:hypothetical protein
MLGSLHIAFDPGGGQDGVGWRLFGFFFPGPLAIATMDVLRKMQSVLLARLSADANSRCGVSPRRVPKASVK